MRWFIKKAPTLKQLREEIENELYMTQHSGCESSIKYVRENATKVLAETIDRYERIVMGFEHQLKYPPPAAQQPTREISPDPKWEQLAVARKATINEFLKKISDQAYIIEQQKEIIASLVAKKK